MITKEDLNKLTKDIKLSEAKKRLLELNTMLTAEFVNFYAIAYEQDKDLAKFILSASVSGIVITAVRDIDISIKIINDLKDDCIEHLKKIDNEINTSK